ncbi:MULTISPECIES: helix-turn-helix domain-containing protein [unclassified Luteibacter]|uniref:helix-turn-helix domain-containing protein n=1 Tax=Luteibacter sp. PvP019 TaxID=3156436 RepID=UPI0033975643
MNATDAITQTARVLAVLADGPAVTGEVAAEIGISPQHASAHLLHLMRHGRVSRERFPAGNRRVRYLWSLTGKAHE